MIRRYIRLGRLYFKIVRHAVVCSIAMMQSTSKTWVFTHTDGFKQTKIGPTMVELSEFMRATATIKRVTFFPIGHPDKFMRFQMPRPRA